ncbi:MAG: tetratricopeptide repeat protein, partial [Acidobacteriota bacterium]
PLVDGLMRKQKEAKAIGLLGLILAAKQTHIPTLEKLAEVYKTSQQRENLEKVYNILLEEYERAELQEKQLSVLERLFAVFPERNDYRHQYKKLRQELGLQEDDQADQGLRVEKERIREAVSAHLAKAELYAEQGLFKNARRILEDLRMRYPEEELINQKIEELKSTMAKMDDGELIKRVEKATEKETVLFGQSTSPGARRQGIIDDDDDVVVEEKVTAADIFAETDIIPVISREYGPREFYDLGTRIQEELKAIKEIYNYQLQGDTAIVEKALSDIVSEFKKALNEKVDKEDYESRYNLGIAFMEQGLFEEAIEEFNMVLQDELLLMDACLALALCYKEKKDFDEAMNWLEEARKMVKEDTFPYYALKYEEASLLEVRGDKKKAAKIYNEIKKWNQDYRDVSKKVDELKSS